MLRETVADLADDPCRLPSHGSEQGAGQGQSRTRAKMVTDKSSPSSRSQTDLSQNGYGLVVVVFVLFVGCVFGVCCVLWFVVLCCVVVL